MRIKILLVAATLGAGGAGIWTYQRYAERYPATDDAYISANVVHVAPEVSGEVIGVHVANQEHVASGDKLVTIEAAPYRYAVEQARARLDLARQQVAERTAAVASARAEVHRCEVLLENARARSARADRLLSKEYLSKQTVEDAEAEFKGAEAALSVARAQLNEALERRGRPGEENEQVAEARTGLDRALWELAQTEVVAPCDGQVGELGLQPGTVVRADTPQFVVICDGDYWVIANYKETDLDRIRPGQPVDIEVDMYPGRHFHGRVESISGASGSAFSLLPPQNASGNWVKVTQRVPVKIRVEDPDPERPLRVGTSSVVTIDTTDAKEPPARADRSDRTGRAT